MRLPIRSMLLALAASACGHAALAADYDPPMAVEQPVIIEEAPEYVPVEVGSGWYLRGDVSYAFSRSANGDTISRTFAPATGAYTETAFPTARYDSDIGYGIGFGYRFNDLIRADLTAERFALRFNGARSFGAPCVGQAAGTTCASTDVGDATATSLMANAYVDLGTFARFTPYVGAGVGYTFVDWNTTTSTYNCVAGAVNCGAAGGYSRTQEGIDSWRFSYAAMAGVAFDINKNLKVDLGYKYRRIAGGDMFGFDAVGRAAGATGAAARDPGFSSHEVKVGLRYELW